MDEVKPTLYHSRTLDGFYIPTDDIEGDWPEDFQHENGCYQCRCCNCEKYFIGYKRRVQCKKCAKISELEYNKLTLEEQNAAIAKAAEAVKSIFRENTVKSASDTIN